MPIPLILSAIATAVGSTGVAKGVSGIKKINNAKEIIEDLEHKHSANQEYLKRKEESAQKAISRLSVKQNEVFDSFKLFGDCFERIQNRPYFKEIKIKDSEIEPINIDNFNKISTVSRGAIIAGVGASIITGSILGIGLMVGGLFINRAGNKAEENAEEARIEYYKATDLIGRACILLNEIEDTTKNYTKVLQGISDEYFVLLGWLKELVSHEVDWDKYTHEDKQKIERIAILAQVLYTMCKVEFLVQEGKKQVLNREKINSVLNLVKKVV